MNIEFSINKLVNWFQINFPDLVQEMKQCEHGYAVNEPNIFHTEGSIWTHTMMVLLQVENLNFSRKVAIAALLHDVGKPISKESVPRDDKIVNKFIGHEGTSVYKSIKVLNQLIKDNFCTQKEAEDIILLINFHGSLFDHFKDNQFNDKKNTITEKWHKRPDVFRELVNLVIADSSGRFFNTGEGRKNLINTLKETFSDEYIDGLYKVSLEKQLQIAHRNFTKTITVLCGVPCVGKSTWVTENVNKKNTIIISRDTTLLGYAMMKYKTKEYNTSWNSLTKEDHTYIDVLVEDEFKLAISRKTNIVIDMTMLSPKSRKKILNNQSTKDYYKKCVFFKTDYDEILKRNNNRNEKYINEDIISSMMKRLHIPLSDEINELEFV